MAWCIGSLSPLDNQNFRFRNQGQATVEFALTLPLWLLLVLGTIQFSLLGTARLTVQYAAYAAARSALVDLPEEPVDPQRAARVALAPVTGPTLPAGFVLPGGSSRDDIPGYLLRGLRGRVAGQFKTRVTIEEDDGFVKAQVLNCPATRPRNRRVLQDALSGRREMEGL